MVVDTVVVLVEFAFVVSMVVFHISFVDFGIVVNVDVVIDL